jgi:bisphosphoglycerate-independent phosphoglycerate mutase (AlkP superfamily)
MRRLLSPLLLSALLLAAVPAALSQEKPSEPEKRPAQSEVAAKDVTFATIERSDKAYQSALEAKDLEGAKKRIGQDGAFKGKVDRVFLADTNTVVILNFARDYKSALVAVLRSANFRRFPDLRTLQGKELLVFGKFEDYQGAPQIVLMKPEQIKLVK